MKYALSLAAILASLSAAPALAADGNVPRFTLDIFGLVGMETLSSEDGMQVRGMSGNAAAMGLSLVTGVLIDPATNSFVFGVDTNAAASSAENAGLQVLTQASHVQASAASLSLDVTTSTSTYSGVLIGGAGGAATASSQ